MNRRGLLRNWTKVFLFGVLVICVILGSLFLSQGADALPDQDRDAEIEKKVKLLALNSNASNEKGCWSNVYMKKNVSSTETKDVTDLMTQAGRGDSVVRVPSWEGGARTDGCAITIADLMKWHAPATVLPDNLLSMGYGSATGNATRVCYHFNYNYAFLPGKAAPGKNIEQSATFQSNAICFPVKDGGKLKSNGKMTTTGTNTQVSGELKIDKKKLKDCRPSEIFRWRVVNGGSTVQAHFHGCMYGNDISGYNGKNMISINISSGTYATPEDVATALENRLNQGNGTGGEIIKGNGLGLDLRRPHTKYDRWWGFKKESSTPLSAELSRGNSKLALEYFSNGKYKNFNEAKLTDDDVNKMYTIYVNNAIARGEISVAAADACKDDKSSFGKDAMIMKRDGKWCKLTGVKKAFSSYNLVRKDRLGLKGGGTLEDVVIALRDADVDTSNPAPDDDDEGGDGDEAMSECHKAGKKIGWITCAVLEGVSDVIEGVYEYIEKEFLYIKPTFFSTDQGGETGSAVYLGWKIFRDIANVIFALLFVIVIFSQLTGFGLDNYGVKRILPRLIMVAILVNISFILCQGAVDVSNILGAGLRNMFEAMIPDTMTSFEVMTFVEKIKTSLLAVGVAAGAAVFAVKNWSAWMMPVLLTLFVSVISVVFFFLLLGARQAGVMIAVVVSPIAIVCYALPNTKKLFDRWYKIFSSLLLVYPIAGLLMGGGKFASTLLVNINSEAANPSDDTGFVFNLVAMLISLIPFFFIPKMVQSSMNAIGNIGTGIQRMGARLRGSAHGAIRSSDTFKSTHKRQMANSYGRRGNRMLQKREERLAAGKKDFSAAKRRKMNRYLGMHRAQVMEDLDSKYNSGDYLDSGHRLFGEDKEPNDAFRRMDASMRESAILDQSKKMTAEYSSSGLFDSDKRTSKEYRRVLRELSEPGLDLNSSKGMALQARAMSLQSQLASSDAGIKAMKQATATVYRRIGSDGTKENQGLMRAASMLKQSHGKVLKDKDRGFFNMNNDVASGKGMKGDFRAVRVANPSNGGKEEDVMVNTAYDLASPDSMDAAKFANMSESGQLALLGGIEAIKNDAAQVARNNYSGGADAFDRLSDDDKNVEIMKAMNPADLQKITTFADNAEAMLLNSSITKDKKAINAANMVRRFDAQIGQTAYEASRSNATDLQRDKRDRRAQELGINDSSDTFEVNHSS